MPAHAVGVNTNERGSQSTPVALPCSLVNEDTVGQGWTSSN